MKTLPYPRYIENKSRVTINGKRYRLGSKGHPYHEFYKEHGMTATFAKMGLLSLASVPGIVDTAEQTYEAIKEGDVYVMSNPAWEGWYKVGMAIDATDRAKNYQTYSPFADFKVVFRRRFKDRRVAEKSVHKKLSKFRSRGEWFQASFSDIKSAISSEAGAF